MGSLLSSAFIPPDELLGCMEGICEPPFSSSDWAWGMVQVLSIGAVYGYVLFQASTMLSDGSELLLLVPSLSGMVGSVILPILGAVPDGAIMLFSGLGPDAQQQLSVGVGALAGSTIMLLTIPWGLSILLGRVDIRKRSHTRRARTTTQAGESARATMLKKKLSGRENLLCGTGVQPTKSIRENALIIVVTAMSYLVIQGPAFKYGFVSSSHNVIRDVSIDQHWWALVGLVLSLIFFCWYLWLMVNQARSPPPTTRRVPTEAAHRHTRAMRNSSARW